MRSRSSHPFFGAGFVAMAHRGFHGPTTTENTVEAFQRAIDLGYRYLESDMQVTSDGVVVLAHDPDLRRIAGRPERIADLTWPQLSTISLRNGERIPRLDAVLVDFPAIHLNLDAKVHRAVHACAAVIERHQAQERVCVGSFSYKRVRTLRSLLPDSAHSAAPIEVLGWRLGRSPGAAHALMVPRRGASVELVTAHSVARAHEYGVGVHIWTVNDPVEMRELVTLGVDGLMTDRADLLKETLLSLGRWV